MWVFFSSPEIELLHGTRFWYILFENVSIDQFYLFLPLSCYRSHLFLKHLKFVYNIKSVQV